MYTLHRRFSRRVGYTLTELMISVGVFAIGASIAYPLLMSDMNLYARNFSLNKSNNSLRYGLQKLKNDIDMAIEPPTLMSYRISGATGILKPLPTTATSAEAMMLWVNIGPAYDMVPTGGSGTGGTVTPSSGITLKRHVYSGSDPAPTAPVPQVGDRLIIMYPAPYSTGMPETVTMDGASITKPGRRITSVSLAATDTTSPQFTVQLDLTNALPIGITGDKSVYIAREVAYVANSVTDASNNVVERQLLCYSTTNAMTTSKLLTRDLDPTPQTLDATTNSTLAFNYGTGRGNLTPLRINLPIRAVDYAHAIADRNLGGQTVDTSSTEFNVFLRSNPQMGIKARLD